MTVAEGTSPEFKYICTVCREPNNYWWLYCEAHEPQADAESDNWRDK